MSGPSQIERLRVAWIDTDAGGRIHFTAAFRWAEAAETALSRRLGLLEHLANLPRRAVSAEYLAVLQFDDELEIELTVEHVGTTSITYVWEVRRDAERAFAVPTQLFTSTTKDDRRRCPRPCGKRSRASRNAVSGHLILVGSPLQWRIAAGGT